MARKPRRIRDLRPSEREHPRYFEIIQTDGWAPYVVCDSVAGYWDGLTIRVKDGRLHPAISDAAQEQMIRMILSGYFGEEMKDVFIDQDRWQRIYDLLEFPDQEVVARESLSVFDFTSPTQDGKTLRQSELNGIVSGLGPTMGPRPTSWSGIVERNTAQVSFTYALRFGQRDLWKIGHATDLSARLTDVNKHVPHEVLGEQWHLVLQQPWPSEVDAYDMEQRVLEALRTSSSVGERVACTRREVESAWTSTLVAKS